MSVFITKLSINPRTPYAKVDRHHRYFVALVVVAFTVVVLPIAVVVATVATAVGAGGETCVPHITDKLPPGLYVFLDNLQSEINVVKLTMVLLG